MHHRQTAGGDPAAWAKGGYESMPDWRYRSKWYVAPDGAYCGLGIHGQTVFVDPAANLVAAKFSSQPSALDEALDATTAKARHAIAEPPARRPPTNRAPPPPVPRAAPPRGCAGRLIRVCCSHRLWFG